jgi:hypothetical protein
MGFCSSCDCLSWHKTSGECSALSAIKHDEAAGAAAATAAQLIRATLRARNPGDDAEHFWDMAGDTEDLSTSQQSFLEEVMVLLGPIAPRLAIQPVQLRQGLAKLALNGHDFGPGRAIWPRAALSNHSCAPSAYWTTHAKRGVGLSITFRALRDLSTGDAVTNAYRFLGGFTAAERQVQLQSTYGWRCQCEACHIRQHDELLGCGADADAVNTLDRAVTEAESSLAQGDAEDAGMLAGMFGRGARRLQLGSAHRLQLRILALRRDAAHATGDHVEAADAGREWVQAAEPVQRLLDPAVLCHELAVLAAILRAMAEAAEEGDMQAIKSEADEVTQRATALARAALGAHDDLTRTLQGEE